MIKAGGVTGAILAALLCCALAPTGAGAAEVAFGSPRHLAGPDAVNPQVAVDSQDTATIVWHEISDDGNWLLVRAMRATPGEPPGPVRTLAKWPEFGTPHGCVCPKLAMDSAGRAAVTWLEFDGAHFLVRAIALGADGVPIGPARTLSPAGEDSHGPLLAMDSVGRATVTWRVERSPDQTESARLLPDGTLEPAQTISEPGVGYSYPGDIAIDPEGRAAIVLNNPDGVHLARIDADGTPMGVQKISPPGEDAGAPNIAFDSRGTATVVWMRFGSAWEAMGAQVDPDGTLGPVQTLTEPGEEALEPKPAVGPDDHVSVVWSTFSQEVKLVRLGPGAAPGPSRLLSDPARTAGTPQIVPLGNGTDLVVWAHTIVGGLIPPPGECNPGNPFELESDVVQATLVGPEGFPGSIRSLSAMGEQSLEPVVAVDSQGRATLAWQSFDGTVQCSPIRPRIQWSQGDWPELPPSSSPPPPPPPAAGTGILRLAKSARLRGRRLVVRASCLGAPGATCRGLVRLVRRRLPGSRPVTLSRGRYAFQAQRKRLLALPLSRHGRKLLGELTRQSLRAAVDGRGVQRGTVMVLLNPTRKGCPCPTE